MSVDPDITLFRHSVDSRTILHNAASNLQTLHNGSTRIKEEQSLLLIVETYVGHLLFASRLREGVCRTERRTFRCLPHAVV